MNFDDETLMAYADGELDEARRAEIGAAIAQDPQLARRVERHRALRAQVAGAFATVLNQPIPERLVSAVTPAADQPTRGAAVLPFPGRTAPAAARQWGGRQWVAMAASLVLGVFLSWKFLSPAEPLMTAGHGALVARGALASALDQQLASTQGESDAVQIGLTFRDHDGQYCRSFALAAAGTAGLACHVEGEWRIPVTAATPASSGELRPAASPPPAVLQAVEARISGEAFDAAGEEQARRSGWDLARP